VSKSRSSSNPPAGNRYGLLLEAIFRSHYSAGVSEFVFERSELETAAATLSIQLPKNLGDLIYSFRYRTPLPESITLTATPGLEWVIEGAGRSRYRMIQRKPMRLLPSQNHHRIKIPDATPEIVARYSLSDEQALLTKVRYNRLLDIFLAVTSYSLQNHLRTTVTGIGQVETDELYVAVNKFGQQFAVPVQAKGRKDQINLVQVGQDLALCRDKYPSLVPRPVAVQFVPEADGEVIVMFELTVADDEIRVLDEKHYCLVPAAEITTADLAQASATAK
jgi:hypothetical protein